jgi:hypothetical protein
MSPKAEVNSEHSRKRHIHCGLMAPRRDPSSKAGASNHANTPRCAVLLLVPASASAFCVFRALGRCAVLVALRLVEVEAQLGAMPSARLISSKSRTTTAGTREKPTAMEAANRWRPW